MEGATGLGRHLAQWLLRFEPGLGSLQKCELLFERGIPQLLQVFFQPLHPLFDGSDVGEHELVLEIPLVTLRIDSVLGMRYRGVLERPDDDHGQRDPDPETCKLKHQEKEGIAPLGPTRLAYCIRAGPTSLAHSLDVQNVVANLVLLSPNALAGCKSWGIVHE